MSNMEFRWMQMDIRKFRRWSEVGIVRCANPLCGKLIFSRTKKENAGGCEKYCSRKCKDAFSPLMLQVSQKWYDKSEDLNLMESLKRAIRYVNRNLRYDTDRARTLGIHRETYIIWRTLLKI